MKSMIGVMNMHSYLPILNQVSLFQQMKMEEIEKILSCLSFHIQTYKKNEIIIFAGSVTNELGVVLTGNALIVKEDFWGNRAVISEVPPAAIFGEMYACNPNDPYEVSVIANEDCTILYLSIDKIITTCPLACSFHKTLIQNLIQDMSRKNRKLMKKVEHMSKHTTREKILSYLSTISNSCDASSFTIPFNRQELADYLSVDRSALSNELSKLKEEGILDYQKNKFILLPSTTNHNH